MSMITGAIQIEGDRGWLEVSGAQVVIKGPSDKVYQLTKVRKLPYQYPGEELSREKTEMCLVCLSNIQQANVDETQEW